MANHPNLIQKPNTVVTVSTLTQWNTLGSGITELTVSNNSLNDASLTVLDLTRFRRLKKIVIGDECFMYVEEVKLIGLSELESVEIGNYSYSLTEHAFNYSNRHFYLKNCPSLMELRIVDHSFSDYSVCAIENVDALERIVIGDSSERLPSFSSASLELKSILIQNE